MNVTIIFMRTHIRIIWELSLHRYAALIRLMSKLSSIF